MDRPGTGPVTGVPPMETVPSSGRERPEMSRSRVDLPQPEGPTTARKEPLSTSRDTRSRTRGPPG